MKAVKIIGIIVLALIVLFLLVALVLPSKYSVERSIVVNRSPEFVFNQIADYNNFTKWNPWTEDEPDAKNKITGTPMTAGHKWEWEGENIGKGYLKTEEVIPGKRIESKLVFEEPNAMEADNFWNLEKTQGGTKVTWVMTGDLGYPGGRYIGLFIDGMIGPDFDKGLQNLKKLVESAPKPLEDAEKLDKKRKNKKESKDKDKVQKNY